MNCITLAIKINTNTCQQFRFNFSTLLFYSHPKSPNIILTSLDNCMYFELQPVMNIIMMIKMSTYLNSLLKI